MNTNLEKLLRLEELLLRRETLLQIASDAATDIDLDRQIQNVRRQVPGRVLSEFDLLARRYANPVAAVERGCCQGCQGEVPARMARGLEDHSLLIQCRFCGRFLVATEDLPDYLV